MGSQEENHTTEFIHTAYPFRANCEEKGCKGGLNCSRCGRKLVDQLPPK